MQTIHNKRDTVRINVQINERNNSNLYNSLTIVGSNIINKSAFKDGVICTNYISGILILLKILIMITLLLLNFSLSKAESLPNNESLSNEKKTDVTKAEESVVINVQATKDINVPQEYNKNAQVIDSSMLHEGNQGTINDVLKKIPGITVGTDFRNVIDIRGQGEKSRANVQVLIDDMPLNLLDNFHYFPGYDIIPSETIDKIEILPGGGSVIYGNGTQGGVVSMLTNFRVSSKPLNSGYFSYGSFNTKRIGVNTGKILFNDRLFLQMNYGGETSQGYLRNEYANTDFYSFASKIFLTKKQILGYAYSKYSEDGKYSGIVSAKRRKESDGDWRVSGTIYDRNRVAETHKLTYKGIFNYVLLDDIGFTSKSNFTIPKKGTLSSDTRGNKSKMKLYYGTNQKSSLLVGNDIIEVKQKWEIYSSKPNKTIFNYKKTTQAVFALNKIYLGNFYSTQGYRYNKDLWKKGGPIGVLGSYSKTYATFNKNYIHYATEASIGYDYRKDGSIWVRRETGFTAPEAHQLTDNYDGLYKLADLKYETFVSYEVGVQDMLTPYTYVRLVAFNTDTNNEINILYLTSGTRHSAAINHGNTTRRGIELTLEQDLKVAGSVFQNPMSVFFSGVYVDARFKKSNLVALDKVKDRIKGVPTNTGQQILKTIEKKREAYINKEGTLIAKVPPISLNMGFKYQVSDFWQLKTTVNYISPHLAMVHNDNRQEVEAEVGDRWLTDIDLRYIKNNINIGIGVKNLFDERYSETISVTTVRHAMERNYYIDIRYVF